MLRRRASMLAARGPAGWVRRVRPVFGPGDFAAQKGNGCSSDAMSPAAKLSGHEVRQYRRRRSPDVVHVEPRESRASPEVRGSRRFRQSTAFGLHDSGRSAQVRAVALTLVDFDAEPGGPRGHGGAGMSVPANNHDPTLRADRRQHKAVRGRPPGR